MKQPIPIYLLSGFLGSGKTTLLSELLDYFLEHHLKPAVIMNEIGEINIDGQLISSEIPMTAMLSGCICCTISGDLGMNILALCKEYHPDAIIIESTGVANPMEVIDSITEGSLLTEVQLSRIITVVDVFQLLELSARGKSRSLRLMEDQIRCAGWLMLNKADQVSAEQLLAAERIIRQSNPHVPIRATVRCKDGLDFLYASVETALSVHDGTQIRSTQQGKCGHRHHEHCDRHEHHNEHPDHRDNHNYYDELHDHRDHHDAHHRHSFDHVMVYTHYFHEAIDRERFEQLIRMLPDEVYRAKGILRFIEEDQPYIFQYAYRELDLLKVTPREPLPSVAVFIGENFSKDNMILSINRLLLHGIKS